MSTAQDIVTAALAGVAAAQTAYDDSVATLHAAQDFAAVPQTNDTIANMQAASAQVTTLTAQVKTLTDDNTALQAKITKAQADLA